MKRTPLALPRGNTKRSFKSLKKLYFQAANTRMCNQYSVGLAGNKLFTQRSTAAFLYAVSVMPLIHRLTRSS